MALVKLLVDVPTEFAEQVGQLLIEHGAGGVEEQSGERGARLIVYGADATALGQLRERARDALSDLGLDEDAGTLSVRVEVDPNSDWDTAWTKHLEQQVVTPRWVVQPVWDASPPPHGMGVIVIRPTLAFGDGAHATTRLAARAVESFCQNLPDASVLDFGTGTGILALIAALSGARTVVGVDVDAVALSAAAENARLNGLDLVVSFQDASANLDFGFDLVVANLEPRVLLEHAASIARRARDARELVVTGFLTEQLEPVRARFLELGLSERAHVVEGEWSLLVFGPG